MLEGRYTTQFFEMSWEDLEVLAKLLDEDIFLQVTINTCQSFVVTMYQRKKSIEYTFFNLLSLIAGKEYSHYTVDLMKIPYEDLPLFINNFNTSSVIESYAKLIIKWRFTIRK